MPKKNDKLVYLISEKGCLNPNTGASQHIRQGIKQLGKNYEAVILLGSKNISFDSPNDQFPHRTGNSFKEPRGMLYGMLKDLLILLKYFVSIPVLFVKLKAENPEVIYERANYANFSGLVCARLLGVPHCYEVNGIQHSKMRDYYDSPFKKTFKRLEKLCYLKSHHTFFVGSYGDYWNLNKQNWSNVENGIEKNLLDGASSKKRNKSKLDVCFVGNNMRHHGLDILIKACNDVELIKNANFHFYGSGFDSLIVSLKQKGIIAYDHGFQSRKQLLDSLGDMDVGLICGTPEYSSNMKLFDYAAASCAVVAYPAHNMKKWFHDELIFFDGSAEDLARTLVNIHRNPLELNKYGTRLFNRVKSEFTWDSIFSYKLEVIQNFLRER